MRCNVMWCDVCMYVMCACMYFCNVLDLFMHCMFCMSCMCVCVCVYVGGGV